MLKARERIVAPRPQTTLRTTVSIEGIGLHSGYPARAHFRPAPPDHGLVFVRLDHPGSRIPARLSSAATFDYATTISAGGVSIGMVEHALSAAGGLGLDNCLIEIEGIEVPILDGSALPIVRLLHAAGLERQVARVHPLALARFVEVVRGDRRISFEPDGPGLKITYEIDFPHPIVGRQTLTVPIRPQEYSVSIAPARTFGFARDIEAMRARGLARGGNLHNAVVLDDSGVVSGPLRFRDEFVRHKILDLVGDLALLGRPLSGHIRARKAGHALHIEFARALEDAAVLSPTSESQRSRPDQAASVGSELFDYHESDTRKGRLARNLDRCNSEGTIRGLESLIENGRIVDPEDEAKPLTTRRLLSERVLIYAVDREYRINVAFDGKRDMLNSIKHESLFHNQPVRAAGEMDVKQGIITGVNDRSGSYGTYGRLETDLRFARSIVEALNRISAPMDNAARSRLMDMAGKS